MFTIQTIMSAMKFLAEIFVKILHEVYMWYVLGNLQGNTQK